MRIKKVFSSLAEDLALRKVRLKSDPANNQVPYEGYILKEYEDGVMDIFVSDAPEQFIQVQPSQIDVSQSLTNIEKFKLIIAKDLEDKEVACLVKDLNTITDIENILISNGYTFEDLYILMKKFFTCS